MFIICSYYITISIFDLAAQKLLVPARYCSLCNNCVCDTACALRSSVAHFTKEELLHDECVLF